MQSILNAVSAVFSGIFLELVKKLEKEKVVKKDEFRHYTFVCWLCSGTSKFKCKPNVGKNIYDLDCCRCGIENKVRVTYTAV